jgi:endonuclease/exonuclease/phosphatase family metal-dependent hydrolase
MNKKGYRIFALADKTFALLLITILVIALVLISSFFLHGISNQSSQDTFKLASWNLQVFGVTKASNITLLKEDAGIIKDYDIIIVQEIRDASGTAFNKLCSELPQYNCMITSRFGRTQSKEAYGIIYKKGIEITAIKEFNNTSFERNPVKITIRIQNYTALIYTIHTKPEDATDEIMALYSLVDEEKDAGNIIILGDLNADCSYYTSRKSFLDWLWIIPDNADTTVGNTTCAYDRIIENADAHREYKSYGIDTRPTAKLSDHYLVWVQMRNKDL